MSLVHGGSGSRGSRSLLSTAASKMSKVGKIAVGGAVAAIESVSGMRFDPAPAYLFAIELEGLVVGFFTEVSGLELTRDVEDYAEGGNNNFIHKLPGRTKYSNLVFKRGLSVSRVLFDWFDIGKYDFNVQRINLSIIQGAPGHNLASAALGALGGVSTFGAPADMQQHAFQALGRGFGKVKHWNVENAWPVRWKASDLNVSSQNVVIEEIEIAHHGLDLTWEILTPLSPGGSIMKGAISAATGAGKPRELSVEKSDLEEPAPAGGGEASQD